ncbi:MAG: hypothetical protein LUH12_04955 [Bacteroides sp.]|nr:hypothetical protein [Bacteroides sp.]
MEIRCCWFFLLSIIVWNALLPDRMLFDWLLTPEKSDVEIFCSMDEKSIVVANGMVARIFQ